MGATAFSPRTRRRCRGSAGLVHLLGRSIRGPFLPRLHLCWSVVGSLRGASLSSTLPVHVHRGGRLPADFPGLARIARRLPCSKWLPVGGPRGNPFAIAQRAISDVAGQDERPRLVLLSLWPSASALHRGPWIAADSQSCLAECLILLTVPLARRYIDLIDITSGTHRREDKRLMPSAASTNSARCLRPPIRRLSDQLPI